jgi:hypothetical protein
MQRVIFSHTAFTQIQPQATRVLPDRAADLKGQASNDDSYDDENSLLRMVLSVLANVIGGVILLSGMYALPHIIAKILS